MGQVLHGSATTTEAVCRAIQHGQEDLRVTPRLRYLAVGRSSYHCSLFARGTTPRGWRFNSPICAPKSQSFVDLLTALDRPPITKIFAWCIQSAKAPTTRRSRFPHGQRSVELLRL